MLTPKDVYVPVSVAERLPNWDTSVIWIDKYGDASTGHWTEQEGKTWIKILLDDGDYESFGFDDFEFWLEKQSAYILSKEEYEKLVPQWIDVKVQPPEFNVTVFAYCKIYGRYIATHEFIGEFEGEKYGNWRHGTSLGILPPTHWMPLPKPPFEQ